MSTFKEWLLHTEALALKGSYKGSMFQRLVAAQYKLAPTSDPRAMPAFRDLATKISRQHDFLQSKFQKEPTTGDPYRSQKHLSREIAKQKLAGERRPVVKVFEEPPGPEQEGHPAFSNQMNVNLRWVHDIITHHYGKHPFSARGEYGAYNRHAKTLCNVEQFKAGECLAVKALFTEIVGQTSYYYIYGSYTEQKAVILPDFDHARVGALAPGSPLNRFFELRDKQLLPRADFDYNAFAGMFPDLAAELGRQENLPKSLTKLSELPKSIQQVA